MAKTGDRRYLVLFLVLLSLQLFAQSPIPPVTKLPSRIPGASTAGAIHPRQEPCWQVAGVSKAAIEERTAAVKAANARVEAVCANPALTPQERAQEIREIRLQQRAQINAIITPQQQEAIQACNKARQPVSVAAVPHPGGGVHRGPCGEILPTPAAPAPHPQPVPGTPSTTAQPASNPSN